LVGINRKINAISEKMPNSANCIFREDFYSAQHVMDQGGIITLATIDKGAVATTINGVVTYKGTESLLNGAQKATFMVKMRSADDNAQSYCTAMAKCPVSVLDNQFIFQEYYTAGGFAIYFYIAASASDTSNYITNSGTFSFGSEYTFHVVYDGTLAPGSRAKIYSNGNLAGSAISGTIPTKLRNGTTVLSILNYPEGGYGPFSNHVLRAARIYSFAMTADEVLQDYNNSLYQSVVP
jgi:hypothetical protein